MVAKYTYYRKIWDVVNNGKYEIVSITPDLMPGTLKAMREFFLNEPICAAIKMTVKGAQEMEKLGIYAASEGISLAAIDKEDNDEVAAILINKIHVKPPPGAPELNEAFQNQYCTQKSSKALIEFYKSLDKTIDCFDYYHIDSYCELMFASTMPNYRKQSLGRKLCEASIKMLAEVRSGEYLKQCFTLKDQDFKHDHTLLVPVPKALVAICLNTHSQKMVKTLGLTSIRKLSYENWCHEGKSFKFLIKEPAVVIMGKRL